MAHRSSDKATEAVSRIRGLLADWLRSSTESREPVAEILQLLEVVDVHIRSNGIGADTKAAPDAATGGRTSEATYSIGKKRNEEEVLTEHRPGGSSQPYRCPRLLYEATAKVIGRSDPAIDFDELMTAVGKIYSEPAEFQVRAALRFWLSVTPPILARDRNRYRPVREGKFETDAKAAWTALAKAPKRGV